MGKSLPSTGIAQVALLITAIEQELCSIPALPAYIDAVEHDIIYTIQDTRQLYSSIGEINYMQAYPRKKEKKEKRKQENKKKIQSKHKQTEEYHANKSSKQTKEKKIKIADGLIGCFLATLIIIIISCIYNAPNDALSANRIHIP